MIQRIIVRPLAAEDLVEAATWYERQAEGLGEELIDKTLRAIHRPLQILNCSAFSDVTERFARSDGAVSLPNFLLNQR